MSGREQRAESVFERNLRGLLRQERPFERPAAEASARLEARVVEHALRLAAARSRRRTASLVPRWAPLLAAAALLLALGLGLAQLLDGGAPDPVDGGQPSVAELENTPGPLAPGDPVGDPVSPRDPVAVAESAASEPGGAPAAAPLASLRLDVEFPGGFLAPEALELVLLRQVPLPAVALPEEHRVPLSGGAVALEIEVEGTYDLFVRTPGLAVWRADDLALGPDSGQRLAVALEPGRVLRGRVLDAEGRPLPGATVLSRTDLPLAVATGGAEQAESFGTPVASTGADGRFVLEGASSGPLVLRAGAPGHAPGWFALEPEAAEDVELRLTPEARVEGTARYADGSPASDAWVIVSINGADQRPGYYQESLVDLEGRFRIDQLPDGVGVALAFSERHSSGAPLAFRGLDLTAGETYEVRFELGPAGPGGSDSGRVDGLLLDADGEPVVGRAVFALRADANGEAVEQPDWRASLTEADGRFSLTELPSGPLALYASDDVSRTMLRLGLVELDAGEAVRVEYALGSRRLVVAAVDEAGAAVPLELAMLYRADGAIAGAPGPLVAMARIHADGRAVFDDLGPGPYRLDAFPASVEHAIAVEPSLVPDPAAPSVRLTARAAGSLSVQLLDADGQPAADTGLELVDPDGQPARRAWGLVRTDGAGRLELEGLLPGTWTLRAPTLDKQTTTFVRAGSGSSVRF